VHPGTSFSLLSGDSGLGAGVTGCEGFLGRVCAQRARGRLETPATKRGASPLPQNLARSRDSDVALTLLYLTLQELPHPTPSQVSFPSSPPPLPRRTQIPRSVRPVPRRNSVASGLGVVAALAQSLSFLAARIPASCREH
jgi:hypothetical protein